MSLPFLVFPPRSSGSLPLLNLSLQFKSEKFALLPRPGSATGKLSFALRGNRQDREADTRLARRQLATFKTSCFSGNGSTSCLAGLALRPAPFLTLRALAKWCWSSGCFRCPALRLNFIVLKELVLSGRCEVTSSEGFF